MPIDKALADHLPLQHSLAKIGQLCRSGAPLTPTCNSSQGVLYEVLTDPPLPDFAQRQVSVGVGTPFVFEVGVEDDHSVRERREPLLELSEEMLVTKRRGLRLRIIDKQEPPLPDTVYHVFLRVLTAHFAGHEVPGPSSPPLQHRGETNPRKPRDVDLPNEPKHCIPLLDDNADIRFLLRTMLERDYIVGDFDNAADLLEFLEQKPCDLIVSDLRLPDMDGFDFVSALRAKEHWPRVLLLIS